MPIPSSFQQRIFDEIRDGDGHIVVNAVAGSGKTTTIKMAMDYVRPGLSVLCVAFNSAIKKAMREAVPEWVDVETFHSIGLRMIGKRKRARVDPTRDDLIAGQAVEFLFRTPDEFGLSEGDAKNSRFKRMLAHDVKRLASLAKSYLKWTEDSDLRNIAITHDISYFNGLFEATRKAIGLSLSNVTAVSFDDMVFLPILLKYAQPTYDLVFVDETQDLNAAQWALARMVVQTGGRIVAVGDKRQAIYGFRGARSDSMGKAVEELGATELPLSVTYRCPRVVVDVARKYVPEILHAPDAPEGSFRTIQETDLWSEVKPGDFVLSRTNGVLVSLCINAIRRGVPSYVVGRDIGKGLSSIVEASKTFTVASLSEWLVEFKAHETERLHAAHREDAVESLLDKIESIEALCEGRRTTREVLDAIRSIFQDKDPSYSVIFSSVHRAKGLEADRVYVAVDTFYLGAPDKRRREEEENLYYVAVTRAHKELVFVRGAPKKKKRVSEDSVSRDEEEGDCE